MCLAKIFGAPAAPVIKKVAPGATTVTSSDIGADTSADAESAQRKKKKQGFAATRLADVAQESSGGKSTVG